MIDDVPFRVRYVGGVAVVAVGEDGTGQPLAADSLSKVIELERGRVVVELSPKSPVPSAVLGKLILIHRRVQAAGGPRFRLCCAEGPAREELRFTKLDRIIPTFETLAEAIRGF